MGLAEFLTSLFDSGRISLPSPIPLDEEELRAADGAIEEFEQQYRWEMPGRPPAFSSTAARWAAVRFFRACQFTVFRDVDAGVLNSELLGEGEDRSASGHYSVDLTFRFLPDLMKLASSASGSDPLLDHLRRWGRQWPLSSIGISGIEPENLDAIAADSSLLQLYADRVISTGDKPRLSDARVQAAVDASLGMYRELAAGLSK